MKRTFHIIILSLLLWAGGMHSQIDRVILETYYISDYKDSTDTDGGKLEAGSVTYRIYIDLKPGSRLLKLYGDANHALKFSSTKPFFNNIDGETFAKDMKKVTYQYNTVALDTWLTLGQTSKTLLGKTYFGALKRQDNDGSFIGGANNDGGSSGVPGGMLTNTAAALGIPLTTADGMDTMVTVPGSWADYGIKDFLSGVDTTMFGSVKVKSEFVSNNVFLKNSGVTGLLPDSNQVLVAQLTTKGQLEFELNVEVEHLVNGVLTVVKYVANDSVLLPGEAKSSYLKYPFPDPVCGCKDPNYMEYNPNFECASMDSCLHKIVFGCMDTMACNFDPKANFHINTLCCYPGSCGGRDISVVCPSVKGASFDCDIYPNPAQSSLFLNVTSGLVKPMSYSIMNYFGTAVIEKDLGVNQRILNQEIDISRLNTGIYLIRINIGGSFVNKQFIKN